MERGPGRPRPSPPTSFLSSSRRMIAEEIQKFALNAVSVIGRAWTFLATPRAYAREHREEARRPFRGIATIMVAALILNVGATGFFCSIYKLDYEPPVMVAEYAIIDILLVLLAVGTAFVVVVSAEDRIRPLTVYAWDAGQALNTAFVFGSLMALVPFFLVYPFIAEIRTQGLMYCGLLMLRLDHAGCMASNVKMGELMSASPLLRSMSIATLIVEAALFCLMSFALAWSHARFMSEYYGIPVRRLVVRGALLPWIYFPLALVRVLKRRRLADRAIGGST